MDHLSHPVPSRVLFVIVSYNRLNDWLSHLYLLLIYSCYFVTSYKFSFWHNLFLWYYFYAAIKRYFVPLLRFRFLCHFYLFSCKISSVCRLKYLYSCFFPLSVFFFFCAFVSAFGFFVWSYVVFAVSSNCN